MANYPDLDKKIRVDIFTDQKSRIPNRYPEIHALI